MGVPEVVKRGHGVHGCGHVTQARYRAVLTETGVSTEDWAVQLKEVLVTIKRLITLWNGIIEVELRVVSGKKKKTRPEIQHRSNEWGGVQAGETATATHPRRCCESLSTSKAFCTCKNFASDSFVSVTPTFLSGWYFSNSLRSGDWTMGHTILGPSHLHPRAAPL